MEVGSVFWSDAYAKDLNSYATPGEEHQPIPKVLYAGMDDQFAIRFVDVLSKKLNKTSYDAYVARYGQGYLVLPLMMPYGWFDMNTVHAMRSKWTECHRNDRGAFRGAFVAFWDRGLDEYWIQRWRLA